MLQSHLSNVRLVMRGSDHGFTKEAFTSRIVEKSLGPLLILIKSENGRLFCGQTSVPLSKAKPG